MLARHHPEWYTPPGRPLATYRAELADKLGVLAHETARQAVILAANEVIANVKRHADPPATAITVDVFNEGGTLYCVVQDDGGAFGDFAAYWARACASYPEWFARSDIGLHLVARLFPTAFYVPRSDAFAFNSFILPIGGKGGAR